MINSLRNKLWTGFGALLLVLVLVSSLTIVVFTSYSDALQVAFHDNYNSAVYCDNMRESLARLNQRAELMIWTPAMVDSIDPSHEIVSFNDNLRNQIKNVTLPHERDRTLHLSSLWGNYQQAYSAFEKVAPADRGRAYIQGLLPVYEQIKDVAREISDMNMSNMSDMDSQTKTTLVGVRNTVLALSVIGTIVAGGVVYWVGSAIIRQLSALTRSAREVESGNLDFHVPVMANDEVGQLADAFNSMSAKLREFRQADHDQLSRSKQTTQLAIDSLPDAVFIAGPTDAVEISNRAAQTLFQIEPGNSVADLEKRLKWLAPVYDAAHHGKTYEPHAYRSAVQLFDDGQERFLLPRAVPMLGPDNTRIGVALILVDVTRLKAADEAKSSLVSTVSHELRTPLTAIRMALSLLVNPKVGPMNDKQQSLLKAAREDSERLYRIIENLMSMSRIESGRVEFQFHPLLPAELIRAAMDSMASGYAEKNVKLETIAVTPTEVSADSAAVGSVLVNLLSNALKFTPAGGRVAVGANLIDRFVEFTVTDTGSGVPPEYSHRIFDKFFRVPRREGPTGAGLGLAIAREVVEAHGGTIELDREFKSGTRFHFRLPIAHAATGARETSPVAVSG